MKNKAFPLIFVLVFMLLTPFASAQEGPRRALFNRQEQSKTTVILPAGTRTLADVAYGADPAQRMDVYIPAQLKSEAPIILMVHGGAWMIGDKSNPGVVGSKAARWLPKGIIFISANYRMLPAAAPDVQGLDVATALAYVQQHASSWGGDGQRVVLMGHSAGAHLVSLVSTSVALQKQAGVQPWLGTVSLDGALNIDYIMKNKHPRMYDSVFGDDPAFWAKVSPYAQITAASPPLMLICSDGQGDGSRCIQPQQLAAKATQLGVRAITHSEPLSHGGITAEVGKPGAYTNAIEDFLRSLGLPV